MLRAVNPKEKGKQRGDCERARKHRFCTDNRVGTSAACIAPLFLVPFLSGDVPCDFQAHYQGSLGSLLPSLPGIA